MSSSSSFLLSILNHGFLLTHYKPIDCFYGFQITCRDWKYHRNWLTKCTCPWTNWITPTSTRSLLLWNTCSFWMELKSSHTIFSFSFLSISSYNLFVLFPIYLSMIPRSMAMTTAIAIFISMTMAMSFSAAVPISQTTLYWSSHETCCILFSVYHPKSF